MEKTTKIFLACALGAFIGSAVALELNQYLWWLGLIIGGFVGYISYEFKKVLTAIPAAWAITKKIKEVEISQEAKEDIKVFLLAYLACLLIGVCFIFNMYFLIGTDMTGVDIYPNINSYVKFFLAIPFHGFLWGVIILLMILLFLGLSKKEKLSRKEGVISLGILLAPILFIPALVLYVVYFTLPPTVKFINRFAKNLFILVHSDIRLLCAVDAAIGTSIGYFSESMIIGAIAGGIFGVINYKIVSERILRLHVKT